jgi:hypothetical protein
VLINIYLVHFVQDLENNKKNDEYMQLNDLVYHKKFSIYDDLALENKEAPMYLLSNKQDNHHALDIPLKK